MTEITGKILSSANNVSLIKIGDRILSTESPIGLKEGDSVNIKTDGKSSELFEINDKKVNLKDVTASELLKAKNIPQTRNTVAGASVLLSLGKEVNLSNLDKATANLEAAINKFGEGQIKEIMFLNVLEIEISTESLKFAKFLMNLSNTGQNLNSSLAVLSDLLPEVLKKMMNEKMNMGKGLLLQFGEKITGKDLLSFLQILGYGNKEKPGVTQIINILSQMIEQVELPEKFMKEGEFAMNFIDSQKFNYVEGNESFYFNLPVLVDENHENINFEYNYNEEEGHNLNLSLELEKLGPIRVSVNMKNKELNIRIYVTTDESREILEKNLTELNENLLRNRLNIKTIQIFKAKTESIGIKDFPFEMKNEVLSSFETIG